MWKTFQYEGNALTSGLGASDVGASLPKEQLRAKAVQCDLDNGNVRGGIGLTLYPRVEQIIFHKLGKKLRSNLIIASIDSLEIEHLSETLGIDTIRNKGFPI